MCIMFVHKVEINVYVMMTTPMAIGPAQHVTRVRVDGPYQPVHPVHLVSLVQSCDNYPMGYLKSL